MPHAITLRGAAAAILWGYRPAATVTGWTVARTPGTQEWTLTATVARTSPFELRQVPLLFSAPHAKGFWVWPLLGPPTITGQAVTARLGPPEQ